MPDPVLRVISASVTLVRGSVMQELLALRKEVGDFNTAHDLRSALVSASGWFFQWHEGPVAAVEKVLHIAQADARHDRPRVLHRSLGPATLADTLQISTTHGADKPTDVACRLFSLTRGQDLEPQAHPGELWRSLAAPLYLPPGVTLAPLVQRHVVAVTSEFTAAVDMMRMFSERFGLRVTYQRFATELPYSGDVGAAYVDIPGDGCVTRLHALSRRSLAHPMARLMLGDLHCVLLLLGERAGATRRWRMKWACCWKVCRCGRRCGWPGARRRLRLKSRTCCKACPVTCRLWLWPRCGMRGRKSCTASCWARDAAPPLQRAGFAPELARACFGTIGS